MRIRVRTTVCFVFFCLFFLSLAIALSACSEDKPAGTRDNTPRVLAESPDGTVVYGNELASIDASNTASGYIMVRYMGDNPQVRLQITASNGTVYTYTLSGDEYEVFPLTEGNGVYGVAVYENVSGDQYAQVSAAQVEVNLTDQFEPFLHSNQYVRFNGDSQCVALGAKLAAPADDDLDVVTYIYDYIIDNIKYDFDRAENVSVGYLPDIDKVLEEGKGICFDYAALATAMLRSQGIPTRLVVGYSDDVYHAWISVYIEDVGWVNKAIEFKGTDWVRMDPTYDANAATLDKYIGSGANYHQMYLY